MYFIKPTWPAPKNIHAFSTTRNKGNSLHPYASFNLAKHVGDSASHVQLNRQLLRDELNLPSEPIWLEQVHSTHVIQAEEAQEQGYLPQADASIASSPNIVCTIMVADCLPILICDRQGTMVSAVHAGWRGLANGIIESTIDRIKKSPEELLVWLGPAIGPSVYEVSEDVLESFISQDQLAIEAFKSKPNKKWLANLYLLARMRLNNLGITSIYGGDYCTFSDQQNFFSFRRDGITGRMASLIWLSV
jgi:YfiH family protein